MIEKEESAKIKSNLILLQAFGLFLVGLLSMSYMVAEAGRYYSSISANYTHPGLGYLSAFLIESYISISFLEYAGSIYKKRLFLLIFLLLVVSVGGASFYVVQEKLKELSVLHAYETESEEEVDDIEAKIKGLENKIKETILKTENSIKGDVEKFRELTKTTSLVANPGIKDLENARKSLQEICRQRYAGFNGNASIFKIDKIDLSVDEVCTMNGQGKLPDWGLNEEARNSLVKLIQAKKDQDEHEKNTMKDHVQNLPLNKAMIELAFNIEGQMLSLEEMDCERNSAGRICAELTSWKNKKYAIEKRRKEKDNLKNEVSADLNSPAEDGNKINNNKLISDKSRAILQKGKLEIYFEWGILVFQRLAIQFGNVMAFFMIGKLYHSNRDSFEFLTGFLREQQKEDSNKFNDLFHVAFSFLTIATVVISGVLSFLGILEYLPPEGFILKVLSFAITCLVQIGFAIYWVLSKRSADIYSDAEQHRTFAIGSENG